MRLQKFMAHAGAASRRKSEEYIKAGKVKVNDKIVTELGYKINPYIDRVYLDGKRLKIEKELVYIILNKPIGIVSSAKDEKERKTVVDLIDTDKRIYPVGRLDIDTTGLVLLTNDGDVTNNITHPKNKVYKKYIATVEGTPNKNELDILRNGVMLGKIKTNRARVKILKSFPEDSIVQIEINEGKNHQVKRMFEKIGHRVKKLKRISIGDIELGSLEVGYYRYLQDDEIKYLKSIK